VVDKRFDYFDERWITIGSAKDKSIVIIGHHYYLKENGDEVIRIITARKASKRKENIMKTSATNQEEEFELKEEYDFSRGGRGRFYRPKKISTSMRLDNDILLYLKKIAGEKKIGYQTLINTILRDYIRKSKN